MKTYISLFIASAILSIYFFGCQNPNEPVNATGTLEKKDNCATIQSGEVLYSAGHYLAGQPITTGYDIYGYNYQATRFSGSYFNVYSGGAGFPPYEGDDESYLADNPGAASHWAWPYRDIELILEWNEAWLSNKDCGTQSSDGVFTSLTTPDGKLDRHYPINTYIGSGAWETNHMWGTYEMDGETCNWNYFVKIIAVPEDATNSGGVWYTADGTEIGPDIWGEFAVIQEVSNDPCIGDHGILYKSPAHPGFGGW